MKINRRQFFKSGAACAVMASTASLWSCVNTRPPLCTNPARYGVQLYMFRDSFAKDPRKTLANIAAMGFSEVELFGIGGFIGLPGAPFFGLTLDEMANALKSVNLATPTVHVSGELNDNTYTLELADKLNIEYFIEPLAPELLSFADNKVSITIPDSEQAVLTMAERINQRGKKFHDLGLGFAYHNHHMEFTKINGKTILDLIMDNTDPQYVKLELDLGWVATADINPLDALKKYGNRVIGCHMKDRDYSIKVAAGDTDELMPEVLQLKAPGQGDVDFKAIVAHLDEFNIYNRFVEVDVTSTPFEDAKFGLKHLQSLCS